MLNIKPTPLDEELSFIRTHSHRTYGTVREASPEYKEYAGKIMEITLGTVGGYLPPGKYCVAGGIFRSVFYNEVPNDIDIFLLGTETDILNRIDKISQAVCQRVVQVKTEYPQNITKHIRLVTYQVGRGYSVQFIGQWFTGPKTEYFTTGHDILATFDLTSSCFGIDFTACEDKNSVSCDYEVQQIISHPLLLNVVANKELRVNEFGSILLKKMKADRFYKYITEYGFRIKDQEQLQKFNYVLGRDNDVESDYS